MRLLKNKYWKHQGVIILLCATIQFAGASDQHVIHLFALEILLKVICLYCVSEKHLYS